MPSMVASGPVSTLESMTLNLFGYLESQGTLILKLVSFKFYLNFSKKAPNSWWKLLPKIAMLFEGDPPLEEHAFTFDGWMIRDLTKTSFDVFYGKIDQPNFDPQEWRWSDASSFFLYSFEKGRSFLDDFRQIGKSILK